MYSLGFGGEDDQGVLFSFGLIEFKLRCRFVRKSFEFTRLYPSELVSTRNVVFGMGF